MRGSAGRRGVEVHTGLGKTQWGFHGTGRPAKVARRTGEVRPRTPPLGAARQSGLVAVVPIVTSHARSNPCRVFPSPFWTTLCIKRAASVRARIYQKLYAAIAAQWMKQSAPAHGISLLENDLLPLETFVWNGFGIVVVDAVRGTLALGRKPDGANSQISPATADDAQTVARMDKALCDELAATPVFPSASSMENPRQPRPSTPSPGKWPG